MNTMDLDSTPYRYFVMVADEHSFSRAAVRLNVSQPALSAQIKEFERRLGFPLFNRSTRRVDLTPQGRLFLPNARRMIMETGWARRAADQIRTDQLRIGCPPYTIMMPDRQKLLEGFMLANPGAKLRVTSGSPARLYAQLRDGELDMALMIEVKLDDGPTSAVELTHADGLERLVLRERGMRMLVPVEHAWAGLDRIDDAALKGQQVVVLDRSNGIALSESIARRLSDAGAELVRPPEGTPAAVDRHCRLFRIPGVALGWFEFPAFATAGPAMTSCDMEFSLTTSLTLIRTPGPLRTTAAALWDHAACHTATE
jgi:DNA-binding transcriptional LysR family regulator